VACLEASAKWDSAAACSGEGLAGGRPPGVQTSGEPEYATQASAAARISGCPEMLQIWPFAWPVSQTCSALDGWYVHGVVELAAACFHGFVPGLITQRRSSCSREACVQHVCRQNMPQGTSHVCTVGQKEAQLDGHWRGECECICMPAGGPRARANAAAGGRQQRVRSYRGDGGGASALGLLRSDRDR
jgi:hypothetical protein